MKGFHCIVICVFTSIVLWTFLFCERKKETDPYEPGCPKELFTPLFFNISQEVCDTLILQWKEKSSKIDGYIIERKRGEEEWKTDYTTIIQGVECYYDHVARSDTGIAFRYRIYAFAGDNVSNKKEAQYLVPNNKLHYIKIAEKIISLA